MYSQGARARTATATWLQEWKVTRPLPNPQKAADYPIELAYVRAYSIDLAYIPPHSPDEQQEFFRKRIYSTLHTVATAATPARGIGIETLHQTFNWPQIWRNLHDEWITDIVRSTWYTAIHDIIGTNKRLYRIVLTESNQCTHCGQIDTLTRLITDCG